MRKIMIFYKKTNSQTFLDRFKCLFRVNGQVQRTETKTTTKCTNIATSKLYCQIFTVYNYLYTYCLRNWTNSSSHYGVVYRFLKNFLEPVYRSRPPTAALGNSMLPRL